MRYIKLCCSYLFKSGWYIWLLWLIPSVFVGLLCNPFQIIKFLNIYPNITISHFGDMFWALSPITWLGVLFAVIGIILVSVVLSMTVGQMESHMRSGKLNFKEILSYINNNILVVLVNVVLMLIINFVMTFLLGTILFLFHLMFSGLSNVPNVLTIIFAVIFCACHLVLYMFVMAIFTINIPNMITNGYSLKEGISSSVSLVGGNAFKLALSFLIPFAIVIPFVSLLAKTNAFWVANIVCSLLILSYYSVLLMTSYFELSNTSRYDNRKYYNYNR